MRRYSSSTSTASTRSTTRSALGRRHAARARSPSGCRPTPATARSAGSARTSSGSCSPTGDAGADRQIADSGSRDALARPMTVRRGAHRDRAAHRRRAPPGPRARPSTRSCAAPRSRSRPPRKNNVTVSDLRPIGRRGRPRPARAHGGAARSAPHAASSSSTTSRRQTSPRARFAASRHSCAGSTRRAARSRPTRSFRSPSGRGSSPRSTAMCCGRRSRDWMTLREHGRRRRPCRQPLPRRPSRRRASPSRLEDLLRLHYLPAEHLVLEITERTLVRDERRTHDGLHRLAATGVRLAIDDFGTGYSSLAYLYKLPIRQVKLDRTFIANVPDDPSSDAIVRATVELAHTLERHGRRRRRRDRRPVGSPRIAALRHRAGLPDRQAGSGGRAHRAPQHHAAIAGHRRLSRCRITRVGYGPLERVIWSEQRA